MIISQGDVNENVNMGPIRRRSLLSILKCSVFFCEYLMSSVLDSVSNPVVLSLLFSLSEFVKNVLSG